MLINVGHYSTFSSKYILKYNTSQLNLDLRQVGFQSWRDFGIWLLQLLNSGSRGYFKNLYNPLGIKRAMWMWFVIYIYVCKTLKGIRKALLIIIWIRLWWFGAPKHYWNIYYRLGIPRITTNSTFSTIDLILTSESSAIEFVVVVIWRGTKTVPKRGLNINEITFNSTKHMIIKLPPHRWTRGWLNQSSMRINLDDQKTRNNGTKNDLEHFEIIVFLTLHEFY